MKNMTATKRRTETCLQQIQGGQQMETNQKSVGLLESAGNPNQPLKPDPSDP